MSISVETYALAKKYTDEHGGGGGGTTNYNQLTNKPKINGVTVEGEKSFEDYGFPDLSESIKAAEAAQQAAETAKGQSETFATQAQQSATQAGESATAAQGHASTAQSAATAAQESAEAAAASAEEAKSVIPPTDTAQDGYVPTFRDGDIVWEPPSGGVTEPRLVLDDTTTEDAAYLYYNQDTNGEPFDYQHIKILIIMPTPPDPIATNRGFRVRYDDGHIGESGKQYEYGGVINSEFGTYRRIFDCEIKLIPGTQISYFSFHGQLGAAVASNTFTRENQNLSKIGEIKFFMSDSSLIPSGTCVRIWSL